MAPAPAPPDLVERAEYFFGVDAPPEPGDWQSEYERVMAPPPSRGIVDGASFLLDLPAGTPAVWGTGGQVLWAEGEPLMVAGPQGVGKTSDLGQLAFGQMGVPGFNELYGFPITPLPKGKKVLYLALDRPRQIARALRRLIDGADEYADILAQRLVVHQGPLPFDVVRDPEALAAYAAQYNAGALHVDSLKDLCTRLSDEEAAAHVNQAVQACIADGVEVALAHHNRKANADNKRPKSLADVHGSENLTRGIGSVICLYGAAGDTEIELSHLKQPMEVVGPFVVRRNHTTGRSVVEREGTLSGSERERQLRAHFNEHPGVWLDKKVLADAGLGSGARLEERLLKLLVDGVIERQVGTGGSGPDAATRYRLATSPATTPTTTPDAPLLARTTLRRCDTGEVGSQITVPPPGIADSVWGD